MSAGQPPVPVTAVYHVSDTRTRSVTVGMEAQNSINDAIRLAKAGAAGGELLTSLLIRFPYEED